MSAALNHSSHRQYMLVSDLMRDVRDGDERTWQGEFAWLRENHSPRLRHLFLQVLQQGIREPLLIGSDGRLWDGHHRLYVAHALGFAHVPVHYAGSRGGQRDERHVV